MAGTHFDQEQGVTPPLHVHIVDEDARELKRTGLRLLEAGYVVSSRRGSDALFETIARLRPDLILLDPLISGLDFAELARCCRALAGPRIALHSKVLRRVLHGAISFKDVVGMICKTDDDWDFQQAFEELVRNALPRQSQAPRAQSLSPAASGTHAIGSLHSPRAESLPPAASGTHLIGVARALPFGARVRRGS